MTLPTVPGADGLSTQSKRGKMEEKANKQASKQTNKQTNRRAIKVSNGLLDRVPLCERGMKAGRLMQPARWESHLERKCFILFQTDAQNTEAAGEAALLRVDLTGDSTGGNDKRKNTQMSRR